MDNLSKDDIFRLLHQYKDDLKKYYVKKIGLFGSVLKGTNNNQSDIDLLVEFYKGKKNFDNFIALSFLLEEILQKKVDLLTIEALSTHMKPKILKEAYFESI